MRDEQGLALSHRQILRLFVELRKQRHTAGLLGHQFSFAEAIQIPSILFYVRAIALLGAGLADRLETKMGHSAMMDYLNAHSAKDDEELRALGLYQDLQTEREEAAKDEHLELDGDPQECPNCQSPICENCSTCHRCEGLPKQALN